MLVGAGMLFRTLRMGCHIDLLRQFTLHLGRPHRWMLGHGGSMPPARVESGLWIVFWLAHGS
jgi:hypothetical protein